MQLVHERFASGFRCVQVVERTSAKHVGKLLWIRTAQRYLPTCHITVTSGRAFIADDSLH